MRRDVLAAGAKAATFAGGFGESDFTRNISKEERTDEVITVEKEQKPLMTFRPLGKVMLVRRAEAEEFSSIIITETMSKDKPAEGIVLAIGTDVTTVSIGERIVFGKYAGAEYVLNGETLLLMPVDDVQGVLEPVAPANNLTFDDTKISSCVGRA